MLASSSRTTASVKLSKALPILFILFFISGFTALLYQVAWQRMLGLFSGSDVRSVSIIIASYLLGLGLGNSIGGHISDRLSNRRRVQIYGYCNLGIAVFAWLSPWLFYDVLFLQLNYLAQSRGISLVIVFVSLAIPTTLMGLSLPLLSGAISDRLESAASRIGWLYGCNTLGSGLGTLISGWYIVGTLGYRGTVYCGSILSTIVGLTALIVAFWFEDANPYRNEKQELSVVLKRQKDSIDTVKEWYLLVFISGFSAISLEIIWFRVLDIALQSNAYTYGHLLAFVLISNACGSMLGAKAIAYIRNPKRIFLAIQGLVIAYSALAIWAVGIYWQAHPSLREDLGYINLHRLNSELVFKYLVVPSVITIVPNLLLGFYFPLVQKAVQIDRQHISQRVGSIVLANILGNTAGSLLTGLWLLDKLGTAGSLKLLLIIGLGFVCAIGFNLVKAKFISALLLILLVTLIFFPDNQGLWAALHGIQPEAKFIVAEDSTGVAAVAETGDRAFLLASGQIQANFPYLHLHALLGTIPALLHPHPTEVMIIGLGSGGTPHTIGANPLTKKIVIVELLGSELEVLRKYAKTPLGKPLRVIFEDSRYQILVGDGRRELVLVDRQFDIIEADAIQPWRSRAGMLYSQEFFQEVKSHLAPGGFFVEWDVGSEIEDTFRNVFPYVSKVVLSRDLSILIGSKDRAIEFDRQSLLTKLEQPQVLKFLATAQTNVPRLRRNILRAKVTMYSQIKDGRPEAVNTDLFPKSEYYLN